MRTRGCTVQQALTLEALSVVNQAMVLARQRGHSQVTPLHVANTLLASSSSSSSNGLFRAACLRSHSHPLHCKALELCFNVALNRLPASPVQHLSLSNALLAAFKRAQAHQRRGAIESHQQHQHQLVPPVKIEIEQLIISVLDDPSVGKVMREAGFSSSLVKTNVEQALSLQLSSQNSEKSKNPRENTDHLFPSHPCPTSTHQSDGVKDLNKVSLSLSLNPER